MVQSLQWIGVEIDEVARHMNCHKLPQPVAIVLITAEKTIDEERALGQLLPRVDDDLASRNGADVASSSVNAD